jgi:DNA replicative helicase MCM subunit Mcm2 (Cdc46/Mcm family)
MEMLLAYSQCLDGFDSSSGDDVWRLLLSRPAYRANLWEILRASSSEAHYAVSIPYADLSSFLPSLAAQLSMNSAYVIDTLEMGFGVAQAALVREGRTKATAAATLKKNVHPRIHSLFGSSGGVLPNVSAIRCLHAGRFMSVAGTLLRVAPRRMVERERVYRCCERGCGYAFAVRVDVEHDNTVSLPAHCPNPTVSPSKVSARGRGGRALRGTARRSAAATGWDADEDATLDAVESGARAPGNYDADFQDNKDADVAAPQAAGRGRRCTGTKFETDAAGGRKSNYQEGRLLEHPVSLPQGAMPRSLSLVLEHDLVDSFKPGADVIVTGTVVHRWLPIPRGARAELDVVLCVNSIMLSGEAANAIDCVSSDLLEKDFDDFFTYFKARGRPLAGRDAIVRSVCPQLHGMALVKLSLLVTILGGVEMRHTDNKAATAGASTVADDDTAPPLDGAIKRRGDCHLLLVGDPGTGKSQLMRFASLLLPRAISANAVSTSAAGLTCALAHRDGETVLEPGLLVLADRSLCTIDEFNALRKEDREAMHEAMEQQTVSAAKAGVVSRLNARTTIIAACNPKGKVGAGLDLPALIGIGDALLTRFDLVLALTDVTSTTWDRRLASFLLQRACAATISRLDDLADSGSEAVAAVHSPSVDSILRASGCSIAVTAPNFDWGAERSRQSSAFSTLVSSSGLAHVTLREIGVSEPRTSWRLQSGLRMEDSLEAADAAAGVHAVAANRADKSASGSSAFDPALLPPGVDRLRARREWEAEAAATSAQRSSAIKSGAFATTTIVWGLQRLSRFIQHAKRMTPNLSVPAAALIVKYYSLQRAGVTVETGASASRVTVRMLESLVRLAQAHAKLCFRRTSLIQDAVMAVILMEFSMATTTALSGGAVSLPWGGGLSAHALTQSEFPLDPESDFAAKEASVFRRIVQWQNANRDKGAHATDTPTTVDAWIAASRAELECERNEAAANDELLAQTVEPPIDPARRDDSDTPSSAPWIQAETPRGDSVIISSITKKRQAPHQQPADDDGLSRDIAIFAAPTPSPVKPLSPASCGPDPKKARFVPEQIPDEFFAPDSIVDEMRRNEQHHFNASASVPKGLPLSAVAASASVPSSNILAGSTNLLSFGGGLLSSSSRFGLGIAAQPPALAAQPPAPPAAAAAPPSETAEGTEVDWGIYGE